MSRTSQRPGKLRAAASLLTPLHEPITWEHRCGARVAPYRASISFRNFVYSVSAAARGYELSRSPRSNAGLESARG